MKISSQQFLKAVLIGAGLVAVLFAYRANDTRKTSSNDLFFGGTGSDIRLGMPGSNLANGGIKVSLGANAATSSPESFQMETGLLPALPNEDATPIAQAPSIEEPPAIEETPPAIELTPEFEFADVDSTPIEPQWIDDLNVEDETVNEVMPLVETRQRDAFEDMEFSDGAWIPANVDESEEAVVVSLAERTRDEVSVMAPPEPARVPAPAPEIAPNLEPGFPPVAMSLNEVAAHKAVHHIEYGKTLARRNATEAAGQEFLGALRVLAESNDMGTGSNAYMRSLRSGLQALKEAKDFKNNDDPQQQIMLNVASIIEGHETQIIGAREARTMTASGASRRYLEYAGLQLGTCGGQNPVSAEALFCLGKMRTIAAQSDPDPESKNLYEAVIFQHAALTADPQNHRSANELGVLLARTGQLKAAESYLKHSLQIKPTPQGWANLAKVHKRKGTQEDQRLANLAINEYEASLYQQVPDFTSGPIHMVAPQEFIARSPIQHAESTPLRAGFSEVIPASHVSDDSPSVVQRIGSRIGSLFSPGKTTR